MRVLVLEREIAFRDRVRGEQMHCWGVAEARRLGIYELLLETCGSEVRYWSSQLVGFSDIIRRDLFKSSPHRAGSLNFYHPEMQAVLIAAAEKAGATVLRGLRVIGLLPEAKPGVRARWGSKGEHVYHARLLVGADGRNSMCRQWGGFHVEHDPVGMTVAGLRIDGLAAPEDTLSAFIHPHKAEMVLIGDAAASNDPCFGCGLSLTLRDVRVLADNLLTAGNWSVAADAYAEEHDRYYGAIHCMTSWARRMYFDPSREAIELRERALPQLIADRTRGLDIVGIGPDFHADEIRRRRFFCED